MAKELRQHSHKIIYEDNHLIAIHKPAGMLTHSDITGDTCSTELTKNYIKEKYNKPGNVFLQPVHRLDRPVSGLLLFARTSKATSRMTQLFKNREVQKTYLAISHRSPKEMQDTLIHYLQKNQAKNIVKTVSEHKGQRAELQYKVLSKLTNQTLFQIQPKTGRSHQIRVQLASIGCPIIGDVKYGSTIKTDGKSIALHAYQLEFIHPVKKEKILLECDLPKNKVWSEFKENI